MLTARQTCTPVFPLTILLDAPDLTLPEAQHLCQLSQHALDDLNDFSAHHLRLLVKHPTPQADTHVTDSDLALTVRLNAIQAIDQPSASISPHAAVLDISYGPSMVPTTSSTSSTLGTFIATHLQAIFAEEQAIVAHLSSISRANIPGNPSSKPIASDFVSAYERRNTRAFKYAPTYHLTFSLLTSAAAPSSWDIEAALSMTMAPLLSALSLISNFTVDTQVQPYATLPPTVQPMYDDAKAAWTLTHSDLASFINAAEWPLSPSIGAGPTINFVLYVPTPEQSPLVLAATNSSGSSGPSWLIPQWGAIHILNLEQHHTHLPASALQAPLLSFASHLLALTALPTTPASLPLQLSALARTHTLSLLLRASGTLGSLARLVHSLPSISIPDAVALNTDAALAALSATCAALRQGRFGGALDAARTAEAAAETAFFEPSMVGQVYFPDEHKVAVYLPLLGPVAVPLVLAAVQELRAWRASRA